MKKTIFFLLVAILVAGCVTPPVTGTEIIEKELRSDAIYTKVTYIGKLWREFQTNTTRLDSWRSDCSATLYKEYRNQFEQQMKILYGNDTPSEKQENMERLLAVVSKKANCRLTEQSGEWTFTNEYLASFEEIDDVIKDCESIAGGCEGDQEAFGYFNKAEKTENTVVYILKAPNDSPKKATVKIKVNGKLESATAGYVMEGEKLVYSDWTNITSGMVTIVYSIGTIEPVQNTTTPENKVNRSTDYSMIAVGAIVLLLFAGITWFLKNKQNTPPAA